MDELLKNLELMEKVKITYIRSVIHCPEKQKNTLKALGLKKLNDSVIKNNTPQIQGMIRKIKHLLKVEHINN